MQRNVFIFWSILIAVAAMRVIFSFNIVSPDIGPCQKQVVSGTGTIFVEPEHREGGQIVVIRVHEVFAAQNTGSTTTATASTTSCATDILIRIKAPLYPKFVYGDEVAFQGKLSQPFNFRSDEGREFDYKGYLAKDDIFYEIKSGTVEFVRSGQSSISSVLYSFKRAFVENLERALGEPHAALASGLLVGEKSALGSELIDDFRTVGLIHIVVLSGYNITIVADVLRRILSFLPRVWGIVAGGAGIAAFGVLVGGGATVVRSCCMSAVALSADLVRRDYSVYRGLFFAGLIMLIQNPFILLDDPSFQLSFMATFGLIVLSEPIERHLGFITEKWGIRGIVASSVATQLFVSPYLVYMMGNMSIIGFISNILVLPFVPLTMLLVFLTGISGFVWSGISLGLGWVTHLLLSYELMIVQYGAKVPLASIHFPLFSGWITVAIYCVYAVMCYFLLQPKRSGG
jgi:competence protein ComEC